MALTCVFSADYSVVSFLVALQPMILHHHHLSFIELGHLLTRSGLTYPEVFSKFYHDSFYQLRTSISVRLASG